MELFEDYAFRTLVQQCSTSGHTFIWLGNMAAGINSQQLCKSIRRPKSHIRSIRHPLPAWQQNEVKDFLQPSFDSTPKIMELLIVAMFSKKPIHQHCLKSLRLLACSWLALVYLFTATPIAPAFTALLALADRSHHLEVIRTDNGTQIILHHDCQKNTPHIHGIVARALTLIAQEPTCAQPDHVIRFTNGNTSNRVSAFVFQPDDRSLTKNALRALLIQPRLPSLFTAHIFSPPPSVSFSNSLQHVLSSTVLLI